MHHKILTEYKSSAACTYSVQSALSCLSAQHEAESDQLAKSAATCNHIGTFAGMAARQAAASLGMKLQDVMCRTTACISYKKQLAAYLQDPHASC